MDHSSQPFTLGDLYRRRRRLDQILNVMSAARIKTILFHYNRHSVRTHYLLEIDSNQFMSCQTSVPEWVEESLRRSPFVVVRRGVAMDQEIPVGVRGTKRNQRWPAFCHSKLVKRILTPSQLLDLRPTAPLNGAPALRSLDLLKKRWMDLDQLWGPGGSVGFELATGREVVNPESDLDIVIYAETRMTVEEAKSLWTRAMDLPAVVDVRVETPFCGFSLGEFVSQRPGAILLRSPSGFVLRRDPWANEVLIETETAQERGLHV
jgi:phosphoribosyl-dephospho-CoA transferase